MTARPLSRISRFNVTSLVLGLACGVFAVGFQVLF
jgi:hypothetical protein